jgi:alkylation response protein AidB-like acyl-CoA dehydrogenase
MDHSNRRESHCQQQTERLLGAVRDLVPAMSARGEGLDRESGGFPTMDLDQLRSAGALSAVVPKRFGGLGLGVDPGDFAPLFKLLRLIGRGSLAVGRIFEGHVNAVKLVCLFGNEAQARRAAKDAKAGHLFGIWNTEAADGVLLLNGRPQRLKGTKIFCSAAGQVTRALITAREAANTRLLLIPLMPGERVKYNDVGLHGMRATQTANMIFDEMRVSAGAIIGKPNDYAREPYFSAGAWRASAVTLGGLDALIGETRQQLISRNRHKDPHQLSRIGEVLIARESARMWIERAASMEENKNLPAAAITGYVNLARIALETAALDIIRLVQRTLGLAGFLQTNPVERLMRDLATYLRQPAADEALTEAAAWFCEHQFPEEDE